MRILNSSHVYLQHHTISLKVLPLRLKTELTEVSDEVFMGGEGFEAASISDVPNTEGLVVRGRQYVLSPGVENYPSNPVVVTD